MSNNKKSDIVTMSREYPCLAYILCEMCKRVGADPGSLDFNSDDWYNLHSWKLKTKQQFIKWLTVYLGKNVEVRCEIMDRPTRDLDSRRGTAQMFVFVYGWRCEDE